MNRARARFLICGNVQGVGFRPFVFRLANELRLGGWVSNSGQGVLIEAEGPENRIAEFLTRIQTDKPPLAQIQSVHQNILEPISADAFEIRASNVGGARTALILPDIATCGDCQREIFDPAKRRYLYPFTNCTNCGPRFSIIESLPYDRANTSMKHFTMCAECEHEYHDPHDRRFHAQPNACPNCGPKLEFWNAFSQRICAAHDALLRAAQAIRNGQIVALKGIGGFQLVVDARNDLAVQRLRERKRREEKPFAVMFPSLDAIQRFCNVSKLECELLQSPAAPIVLLKRCKNCTPDTQRETAEKPSEIAESVSPRNPLLGVMLPCSPLHHLLLRELNFPVVATSGNLSDEPICTDEREATERLRGIADVFLVHNRPIVRHVDDSVVRVMLGREMILRRARGYAPMPIQFGETNSTNPESQNFRQELAELVSPKVCLAVGAHLKNSIALAIGENIFLSQHIGDLETAQAFVALQKIATDLPRIYNATPEIIAHDLHPEYLSTKFARQIATDVAIEHESRCVAVQHHYAHILSCMAENDVSAPALGIAWDGTGLGTDGTIWGGEFLRINETSFERAAYFRQFRLPGGHAAVKQPRRTAIGLLHEMFGAQIFERNDLPPLREFSSGELRMLKRMLENKINSPLTSSAGRLFDAVASIVGLRQRWSFEGQAAMELEFAIQEIETDEIYPVSFVTRDSAIVFDWQPMIEAILANMNERVPISKISATFHNTLAEGIVEIATRVGESHVALSGGCFQNQFLLERTLRRLRESGFVPHWHRRVPPNDGGVAFGQIIAARRSKEKPPLGSAPDGQQRKLSADLNEAILNQ